MKAIAYLRVSTQSQVVDGVSLEAQEAKCRAWCQLNDTQLAGIYTDQGISGKKANNRNGLQAALKELNNGDVLLVFSLSRLSRSTKDTLEIAELLAKRGADLVSLCERIDTTSSSGRMVFRLLAVLSEFERDQVSERTRAALQHKKQNLQRVGTIPYGFDADGGNLLPNYDELGIVAKMRELRDTGSSYHNIASALNDLGARPKNGAKLWYKATVRRILLNDIYDQVLGHCS